MAETLVLETPDPVSDDGAAPAGRRQPPWRQIVGWALIGTAALVLLIGLDIRAFGGSPVNLIMADTTGPATSAVQEDFPDHELRDTGGFDGPMYYAIARNPLHPTEVAQDLEWPRYRMQRPLLPLAAWALHPSGGGLGLVFAFFAVGLAAVIGGAVATGYLSWMWGGPARLALLFPLLPGTWFSLRGSMADALSLALALGAICLAARNRTVGSVILGVLAVLAKEPAILILGGWWLAHRTRRDLWLVAVPGAAIVALMGYLHVILPPDLDRAQDMGLPFAGLGSAWSQVWSQGYELAGLWCMVAGVGLAVAALALRGLRHPLGWAVAVQLGFLLCMGLNPTAMFFGSSRMTMASIVLSAIALATPRAAEAEIGTAPVADSDPRPEALPAPA